MDRDVTFKCFHRASQTAVHKRFKISFFMPTGFFPSSVLQSRGEYFFQSCQFKVFVKFALERQQAQMRWNLFAFLLVACFIRLSHSASVRGEYCRCDMFPSILYLVLKYSSSVGQCEQSDGKCSEASDCKYIWTDSYDCTAKQRVCCYNDHGWIDP